MPISNITNVSVLALLIGLLFVLLRDTSASTLYIGELLVVPNLQLSESCLPLDTPLILWQMSSSVGVVLVSVLTPRLLNSSFHRIFVLLNNSLFREVDVGRARPHIAPGLS
jgi:hypothetical protein